MKKHVLIGSVLLAAVSAFSQNSGRLKPTGLLNTKILAENKFGGPETAPSTAINTNSNVKPIATPAKKGAKTNAVNWSNFTGSMNIYGMVISFAKPLQWNDELDAVSFVHRKSLSYSPSPALASNAESGAIVAMISSDCGETWDSTMVFGDDNYWGRYPNGAIYNPPGNTDISNAYVVAAGPATGNAAATWLGNYYASKKLDVFNNTASTAPGAQQVILTAGPFPQDVPSRHDFAAYAFSSTDDGKVRILAGITDDGLTSDTAVMLMTGSFNGSTNTFDWAGTVFDPPTVLETDGSENFVSRPVMAWNETGTVGYVVIMGSRLGATGSNVGFQPIVYKTSNSGSTWSLENGINFNASNYDDVKNRLWAVANDTTLVVPNFMWMEGYDCTVDANDKLHIFTTLLGHYSNHPDSLSYINQWTTERYLWPHQPGYHPYLYDFTYDGTSWSHSLIDSMSTEGISAASTGAGYQDNPWDPDPSQSNQKVRIDARLQMSRTPDGKHLLYTWTESDTSFTDNQKKWNNLPNIKARLYDVDDNYLSPTRNDLTEAAQGEVANRAMYYFISPKFKMVSKSGGVASINLPTTISNSNPYSQLTANTHWYSCAGLDFSVQSSDPVGIAEHAKNSANSSLIYPNPAKSSATLSLNLTKASKVQVQVMNTIGQVLKTTSTQGQTGVNTMAIDLNGLASGIYLVNVKVDNASSTKKLVVE